MSVYNGLFTSEAVSIGHPDKLCDRISDAILDAFLRLDPDARVACETFAADNKIIVAGEFRTTRPEDFHSVRDAAVGLVRQALRTIGYGDAAFDIDPDTCEVEVRFNRQNAEIAAGVDREDTLGAGDQGLMFGHAVDETEALMPLAWSLATDLVEKASSLIGTPSAILKPDGKAQVTVRYSNGVAVGVETVVLSWQHDAAIEVEAARAWLAQEVLDQVVPAHLRTADFKAFLNPAGSFTVGGPKGDTGLTGRKIIVDSYGGACPHGGGAFSGKDPTKVDRSAAYAARHIAKHIVGAGLAKRCTVQLAYAIGVADPVSVNVETYGTGRVPDDELSLVVQKLWDLTPSGIIRDLDLLRPIYEGTSALGHFGRWKSPEVYRWERLDRKDALLSAVGGYASDFSDKLEITTTELLQRGWTRTLIKRFLPKPDGCVAVKHWANFRGQDTYATVKIWNVEHSEEFATAFVNCWKGRVKGRLRGKSPELMLDLLRNAPHPKIPQRSKDDVVRDTAVASIVGKLQQLRDRRD